MGSQIHRAIVVASLLLAGCSTRGLFSDHRPLTAQDKRDFLELLGNYPSPGENASSEVHDPEGRVVEAPSGPLVYADQLISYEVGFPDPVPEGQDALMALGPPDYTANVKIKPRSVSLGNGGTLVLGFSKAPLIDGEGPDLYIYEIGPAIEAVEVAVSMDAATWVEVGTAWGGPSAVDIGPYVSKDDVFRFVRIRDVRYQGVDSDAWPGADIDAVGMVARAERVVLPSEVLFGFDRDELEPGASVELDKLVSSLTSRADARVTIDGHTDNVGRADYNQKLSERRAQAVAAYLEKRGIAKDRIVTRGFGESRPFVPNDGPENRKKNRRVEIVIR